MPRHHTLASRPEALHWGFFDAALEPVLEVDSGDRVTIDCLCGQPETLPDGDRFTVLPDHLEAFRRVPQPVSGHLMTGPIAVRGARVGDVLEVRILEVRLRQDWGYNRIRPLGGTLPEDFPSHRLMHIPLDAQAMIGRLPWGTEIPLRPFFGVLGVAPPLTWGRINSIVPRQHGGNLDLKELTAGTTLFLPVFNDGALFSAGDGHAAQGDGEVCSTAIETSLAGTFELIVRRDLALELPRAETPSHYVTLGLDEDLDDAAKQALRQMIRLVGEVAGLGREDAYTLCSLAGDLRVTQLVNGCKGVHMMLAKALVQR